jgi:hypothetical protein
LYRAFQAGYSQVQDVTDAVEAFKGGFFLVILFLFTGGQNFWQVVTVGGDASVTDASDEVGKIKNMIASLPFM